MTFGQSTGSSLARDSTTVSRPAPGPSMNSRAAVTPGGYGTRQQWKLQTRAAEVPGATKAPQCMQRRQFRGTIRPAGRIPRFRSRTCRGATGWQQRPYSERGRCRSTPGVASDTRTSDSKPIVATRATGEAQSRPPRRGSSPRASTSSRKTRSAARRSAGTRVQTAPDAAALTPNASASAVLVPCGTRTLHFAP